MIADLQQQLGIDSSFFIQFVLFCAFFLFMRAIYFAPFLRLIERREGQSGGLSEEADKLHEESSRLEAEYQEALLVARRSASTEREAVLAEARKIGAGTVAEARAQAKVKLEQAREAAARSAESDLAGLKSQVPGISAALVNKLMNNKVGL